MITLAATNTLRAVAGSASAVTLTVFGTEITGITEVSKVLYQNQLPAATTSIYTAPGGAVTLIKSITAVNLKNVDTTFQLFVNGTTTNTAITTVITLPPFTAADYDDMGWVIRGYQGQILTETSASFQDANYSVAFAETFDRNFCEEANLSALSTGRLSLQAIWLTAGEVINWISFHSATTAANAPTNQLFGLYDINRNLLATTANDTTGAWSTNSIKTLKLSSPYTVTTSGLYYLGIMVTATTAVPTLKGLTALTSTQLHGASPILGGTSSTGLTTSLPNPAAALTVATTQIWGCVS